MLYSYPVILGLNQNIFQQPSLLLQMNVYFQTICYGFYFLKGEREENFLELDFSLPRSSSLHSERLSYAQVVINHGASCLGERDNERAFDKELTDVISEAAGPLLLGHLLDGS